MDAGARRLRDFAMHYVIIGAGPAGVTAAEAIRQGDPGGAISLIGDEPEAPYSRMAIPYLLTGQIDEAGTHLRPAVDHYARLGIDTLSGCRVTNIDPLGHQLSLDDGRRRGFDRLLIATGSHPSRPPIDGLDLPGVHHCWTLDDARRIAALAKPGAKVVLMGAGFVGTIVLEALARRRVALTVVEMGDRMVPRMMDDIAGTMLKRWCESRGVAVRTSTRIVGIDAQAPSLGVRLEGGETLPADLVVVSTGVRPNLDFLAGSGIATAEGVLVDDHLQTNMPGIYAAGDVCQSADMVSGAAEVHAIQPTAAEHGRVAAANMVGNDLPFIGSLNMNVLDTLGLVSTSFGHWQGNGGSSVRHQDGWRYLRLEFDHAEDRLIGAQTVGLTEHVGVLRGLIQSKRRLGPWKDILMSHPEQFMQGYVATVGV